MPPAFTHWSLEEVDFVSDDPQPRAERTRTSRMRVRMAGAYTQRAPLKQRSPSAALPVISSRWEITDADPAHPSPDRSTHSALRAPRGHRPPRLALLRRRAELLVERRRRRGRRHVRAGRLLLRRVL